MSTKKNTSDIKVVVIGGGVTGLTTGLILNLHGFDVTIVSQHNFDHLHRIDPSMHPSELASVHAAASVIPHSVNHPSEKEILSISQKFFHRLAFSAGFGVRVQRHYELFEEYKNPPEYARTVNDFNLLSRDGSGWVDDHNIPRRKGSKGIYGWYFNAFFAEVPTYLGALRALCTGAGCRFVNKEIKSIKDIETLNADIIINCMGRWAVELFKQDKRNTKIIRGHMVKVGIHEVPHDKSNLYFSYNYAPAIDIYSREYNKGKKKIKETADVYFYPRSDGWLLGGSRQEGYPDIGQQWSKDDEQISGETFKLDNWKTSVPKPIWELNRELILDITGVDIADKKFPSFSFIGYRFGRDPIRIEKGHELKDKTKLLIHNYGHGGAGYTLSWGCAYEVIKLIEDEINVQVEVGQSKRMVTGYMASMKRILLDLVVEEYLIRKKNEFTPYIKDNNNES